MERFGAGEPLLYLGVPFHISFSRNRLGLVCHNFGLFTPSPPTFFTESRNPTKETWMERTHEQMDRWFQTLDSTGSHGITLVSDTHIT